MSRETAEEGNQSYETSNKYIENLFKHQDIISDILEVLPTPIIILDNNGVIQRVNKAFFSYDYNGLTEADIVGKLYKEVLGYTEEEYQKTILYQALQGKEIDKTYIHGGSHDWFINAMPIKNKEGQILGAIGVYLNVTDYQNLLEKVKKAEKDIEQYSKKVTDILESITDCFFALDNDWNFIYINKEAQKILGKKEEELLGSNIWKELIKANTTQCLIKSSPFYENYHKAKLLKQPVYFQAFSEFAKKWLQVSVYPSAEGLAVYFRDITELKEQEEKEKHLIKQYLNEKEKLNQLIELCPVGIVEIDKEEKVEVMNKALLDLVPQLNKEDIIGKPYQRAINYLGVDYDELAIVKAVRNGEVTEKYVRVLDRDWLCRSSPIKDYENNSIIGAVEIFDDITEYEKTRKEINRLDRLNSIGEMAAGIAHEIRNPLTTIRGFLQLLYRKEENAGFRNYYDTMIEELDRCNSIITEFLSLARNDSVELKKNNINDIINTILPLIKADALEENKDVIFISKEVPDLKLNNKEIRQLILNLVRNGLQAMPKGKQVTIRTYLLENEIILSIEDQGPGISEEVLAKLGTPFLTTKENGTGLGLAVCYNIVRRNNARIEVKTSNKGTTFFVRFKNED